MEEKVIFEKKDGEVNIQVLDRKNVRHLRFGNRVKQSSMVKKYPYALALKYIRTMVQGLVLNPNPKNILFLGLGAGSLLKYINKYFNVPRIDVVELLPDVVDISKKYFGVDDSKNVNFINENAVKYLETNDNKYDLIFVDVFNSGGMPKEITTDNFYLLLNNSLNLSGWIVWNTWVRKSTYNLQVDQWKNFFNVVLIRPPAPKSGNVVVFGGNKNNLTDSNVDANIRHIQSFIPIDKISKDIKFDKNFIEL